MNNTYKIALAVALVASAAVIFVTLFSADTSLDQLAASSSQSTDTARLDNPSPSPQAAQSDTPTISKPPARSPSLVLGTAPPTPLTQLQTTQTATPPPPAPVNAKQQLTTTGDDAAIKQVESPAAALPSVAVMTPSPKPEPIIKPAPRTAAKIYAVQHGDTLSSIAERLFGSQRYWVDIAQANPTVDPRRMRVGQKLKLPSASQLSNQTDDALPPPGKVKYHIVRSGESLWKIAKRYYGDGEQWRLVFNANRSKIGSNESRLQAGDKLVIPPSPITPN